MRAALRQALLQRRDHVGRLANQLDRSLRRASRRVFQEQRQKVRQLAGGRRVAALLVEFEQVDHCLAAIAALAMDVLEQVQRQRARAVEQQAVTLLQVVEIDDRDFLDQHVERTAA